MKQSTGQDVETQVDALLEQMTLAEKVGQMTQVEKNSITPDEVAEYSIGSVLSGGGGSPTPNNATSWGQMVRAFQEGALRSRLAIPMLYGVDAVHGHNNVRGATIFPHNIGLGASRDAALVERVAEITAREIIATEVTWNFAPALSVPQDIRWGRTYEGYSEDTAIVAELGSAYVRGLQGEASTVLASAKHFLGDGGTSWGSSTPCEWIPGWWSSADPQRWQLDQGATTGDEDALRATHLPPYLAALEAGARNIMVSYSSWNGIKMHAHRALLTDLLKGELGFDGFLISDWLAMSQLDADYGRAVAASINAGLDMAMVPFDFRRFIDTLTTLVENGTVPVARVDDAVRRILRVKFEIGLFEQPHGRPELLPDVGSAAHRAVARDAVRRSLVLLKNEGQTVPLDSGTPLLVAGRAADNMGLQCGGWTIEWQGGDGAITEGTTLLDALRERAGDAVHYDAEGHFDTEQRAPLALVVLSEIPYAEGEGDRAILSLPDEDVALVQRVRQQCERLLIVLYSGRPLLVEAILDDADALVAAWLPGTEGGGISDVLFGDYPFSGTLPYRWPRSMAQIQGEEDGPPRFPLGHGLHPTSVRALPTSTSSTPSEGNSP